MRCSSGVAFGVFHARVAMNAIYISSPGDMSRLGFSLGAFALPVPFGLGFAVDRFAIAWSSRCFAAEPTPLR